MSNQDIRKVVEEAMSDRAFVASLEHIKTAEEAQKAFAEKGLSLSIEEVEKLGMLINNGTSELGEDTLDDITGGGVGIIFGTLAIMGALAGVIAGWKSGKKNACG